MAKTRCYYKMIPQKTYKKLPAAFPSWEYLSSILIYIYCKPKHSTHFFDHNFVLMRVHDEQPRTISPHMANRTIS